VKAQFSVDFYIALITFVLLISYISFQVLTFSPLYTKEINTQRLRAEAFQISEILVNDFGEPKDWYQALSPLMPWRYRRPITISNPGSALTDYQVLVTLDTASLIGYTIYELPISISSTGTVLADYQVRINITNPTIISHVASDGRDIRFFNQSTNNPYSDTFGKLSYWIESISSSQLLVWVKVDYIPSSGGKTIYMYYGNYSATSQSDNATVFGKGISLIYNRDSYYISLILANREWVAGGTNLGISGDDSGASRTLPASRIIYGTSITTVYLSTNGLLRWDNVADTRYSNFLDTSRKILTVHWDDLYISTSYRSDAGIYEITGSDSLGNYIAYRWATTYYSSKSTPADFEILLYDTKYIQFNVYRVWTSASPNEFISRGDDNNYIDLTPRWQNVESVLFIPRTSPEPTASIGTESC